MNLVIISGRLTKDPEVRYANNGNVWGAFMVAVPRIPKSKDSNKPEADFLRCVAFGKTAEIVGNNLQKGSRVVVEGNIRTGSYTGKDGVKRYNTEILVLQVDYAAGKKADLPEEGVFDRMGDVVKNGNDYEDPTLIDF